MSEWPSLWLPFLAGAGVALFYFGGLWLTVRALPSARRPGLLLAASFVGRMAILLIALYLVIDGRWERLLAAMAGLLLTRYLIIQRVKPLENEEQLTVNGKRLTESDERGNQS